MEDFASDIPADLARGAHRGTSYDPDLRGSQERASYASQLASDYVALQRLATTPEKAELLESEFARKSSKAIKAVIAACFSQWKGRTVHVVEVDEQWQHAVFHDDQTTVVYQDLGSDHPLSVAQMRRPSFGETPPVHRAVPGHAVFIHDRFMGSDLGIEIVIPAGMIDRAALEIAVDAMLQGDKRTATKVLAECGVYSGIAMALAEARAKALSKAHAAADYTEAA